MHQHILCRQEGTYGCIIVRQIGELDRSDAAAILFCLFIYIRNRGRDHRCYAAIDEPFNSPTRPEECQRPLDCSPQTPVKSAAKLARHAYSGWDHPVYPAIVPPCVREWSTESDRENKQTRNEKKKKKSSNRKRLDKPIKGDERSSGLTAAEMGVRDNCLFALQWDRKEM